MSCRSANNCQGSRAMFQLITYGLVLQIRRLSIRPSSSELIPVVSHASLGGLSIILSYYVLNLVPLGDATTIRFSLPIWTIIMGCLFLNESCSISKLSAAVLTMVGVILIANPSILMGLLESELKEPRVEVQYDSKTSRLVLRNLTDAASSSTLADTDSYQSSQHLQGCYLALISSMSLAMSLVTNRMCKVTPIEVIIVWLSLATITIGLLALALLGQWNYPDSLRDFILLLLNGVCGTVGQWFMTNALKVEQSSVVALTRTFDIEVAFLYSGLLLKEKILMTR